MKNRSTLIAAAVSVALVVSGCGTEKEFLAATKTQENITKMTLDFHKELNLRKLENDKEVEIAKSKALVAKAEADKYRYAAFIKVAEKADAGGRVAMARSLEDKDPTISGVLASAAPQAATLTAPVIPTVAMPKSAAQEAKEWASVGLQAVGIGVQGFLGAKQIGANVEINKQNTAAQVANTEATMGAFKAFSLNATNQSIAGYNALTSVATAPKDPTYQITLTGDDNALFGSTSFRSYDIKCNSGNGGNGGNGAPGGTGGTNGSGGGNNTGGAGAPSGSVPCTIQK